MSKITHLVLIILVSLLCFGCASKPNIALSNNFWKEDDRTLAVVAIPPPEPQLYVSGNNSLLEIGIHSMFDKKLKKHLKTTQLAWYGDLTQNFVDELSRKGFITKKFETKRGLSYLNNTQNYDEISAETHSDTLLILSLERVGATRQYQSNIPLDPKVICVISGELIDLKTQDVLWRYTSRIEQPVAGEWDQPPDYPNLTETLSFIMNIARKDLWNDFLDDDT